MTSAPAIHLTFFKTPSAPRKPYNSLYTVTDDTGRVLCSSRTPLLSAARVLLKEGHDPAAMLFLTRQGEASWSIRGTVGVVAKLTVRETATVGPVFASYDADKLARLAASKQGHAPCPR